MAEKKFIELQKALNVCEMHYEHCLEMHDWSGDATAYNIKRDIETLPTADVVEVKHSEWVMVPVSGVANYRCGNIDCCRLIPFGQMPSDLPYCPYCGAKMDGGNAE